MTTPTIRAELDAAQQEPAAWKPGHSCAKCEGKGYHRLTDRKGSTAYVACDCPDTVVQRPDSHSDQAIELDREWGNPCAHEWLHHDIHAPEDAEPLYPGVHPLEGREPACEFCNDTGVEPDPSTGYVYDLGPCRNGCQMPITMPMPPVRPHHPDEYSHVPF